MTTNNIPADVQSAMSNVWTLSKHLNNRFFEREAVVDALLTALIAGEHVALYGEPGIAKSAIVDEAMACLNEPFFSYLMTRFTEPSEVMGEIDINEFKKSARRVRNTAGMLPDVKVAFLDEAFKANSAILNALLKMLNERQFNNGANLVTVPLRTVFLASNEIPTEGNLNALWDRCLLRLAVRGIEDETNFDNYLFAPRYAGARPTVSMNDFLVLQRHAEGLAFSDAAKKAVRSIREKTLEKGIKVSDRRFGKAMNIIRAFAALKGGIEVDDSHVEVCKWIFWSKLDQIPVVETLVEECCAGWLSGLRAVQASLDSLTAGIKADSNLPFTEKFQKMGVWLPRVNKVRAEIDDLAKKNPSRQQILDAQKRAALLFETTVAVARGEAGKIGG